MKIFFASAENKTQSMAVLEPAQAENWLMSYFYLRNRTDKDLKETLERANKTAKLMFLDSGAHSFLAANDLKHGNGGMGSKKFDEDPYVYFQKYKEWLKKRHKHFDMIAELDIGEVPGVGYAQVCRRRDELCSEIPEIFDKLVVVGHHEYFNRIFAKRGGFEVEWERLCKTYPCLAIGDGPPESVMNKYFTIWKRVGNYNRVHGFAETKFWKMTKYPFYSVDSTTRQVGSRFGNVMYYDGIKGYATFTDFIRTSSGIQKAYTKFLAVYNKFEPKAKEIPPQDYWDYSGGAFKRDFQNVLALMKVTDVLTTLWKKKGIDFEKNLSPLLKKLGAKL